MGLLDKIESVLPGHNNTETDKEHTGVHGETTHTDSAVGEHATSTHPHLGHSHHGTAAHTTEHTSGVPVTTSTVHDGSKLGTTPVVSSFTEHQAPITQTTTTPAATTSSHIAGTKLDGSTDQTSNTFPPLAGSVLTGHPARHQDIHDSKVGGSGGTIEHDTSKHTASGLFGHRDHTTGTTHDTHKTEGGVSVLMHKLTGSHSSGHQHETAHTDAGHHTTPSTGVSSTAEHTTSTAPHLTEKTTTTSAPTTLAGQSSSSETTTRHNQAHEGTKFVPNAENPSAIPTAGGRVIGAGQVDHNATGTIGKDYSGDKAFTSGSGATDHAATGSAIVTSTTTTAPAKDAPIPDRTGSGTASTTHST